MLIILEQGEELVAVTMGKRDRDNQDSLTEVKDLTSQVSDGRVFVDVPNGLWCVNVIKTTRKGTGRKNYINTIDHDAVRYFIDQIYEPHYATIKMILEKHLQDFSLMSLKSEALAANMVMMLILENSI